MKQLLSTLLFCVLSTANANNKAPISNGSKEFWKQPIERHNYYEEKATEHLAKEKPELKTKAKELLKHQAVKFLENKGQMTDMAGKPVPFVLYKAEAPGIDMYITETGLTYVMLKHEEEEGEKFKRENSKENNGNASKDKIQDTEYNDREREEKLSVEWHRIDMILKGATIKKENIITEGKSSYFKQYFLGHCPDGITDVHEYEKITIKNIYPNIDWVLYNSNEKGFKYDFIVRPGADYNYIKMLYKSEEPIELDKQGNLKLKTEIGTLIENAPVSYLQERNDTIQSNFKAKQLNKRETEITFNFQSHISNNQTLVIDPQLVWQTVVGGQGDDGFRYVTTDSYGSLYIAGYTIYGFGAAFPSLLDAGTYFQNIAGDIIMKFNNNGVLLWSTFYAMKINDITTDISDNLIVVGYVTNGSLNQNLVGAYNQIFAGNHDAFITKFDNLGNRLWASCYGGLDEDHATGITSDNSGNLYLIGTSKSTNFPIQNTGTFFQNSLGGSTDCFIVKFDNLCNRLWATYYGGTQTDIPYSATVDLNGNLFVVGWTFSLDLPLLNSGSFFQGIYGSVLQFDGDAFILKFDNSGNRLWATYYGGSDQDFAKSVDCDSFGNLFVTGYSNSTNLSLQNSGTFFQTGSSSSNDLFILKFDNLGNRLWATFFGGNGNEDIDKSGLEVDGCNNIYLVFLSSPTDLPFQSNCDNGYYSNIGSQCIVKFSNQGNLLWCSGLKITANGLANMNIDLNNNIYLTGEGYMNSLSDCVNPGNGAYFSAALLGAHDGFIYKFAPSSLINYTLSQTNPTSCSCDGAVTISVTACDNLNFAWSNGSSVSNSSVSVQSITGLCAGIHQVTVTSCGSQSIVASFTLVGSGSGVSTMTPNISTANATCTNALGSVTITSIAGGTPNYTITEGGNTIASNIFLPYVINNVSVGLHNYNVIDANGCGTFSAQVQPPILPNLSVISQVTLTCNPSTIVLNASSTSTNTVSYTWQGLGIINGANTATAIVNQVGTYTVIVNDGSCTNYSVVTVVPDNNIPTVSINSSGNLTCITNSLTLTASGSNLSYTWQPSGANTSTILVTTPLVYTVAVTNTINGCSTFTTISVTQNTTNPTLIVANNSTLNCLNTIVTPTVTGAINYTWQGTGIVSGSNTANPNINQAGTYTVIGTATNGCTNTAIVSITQNTTTPTVTANTNSDLSCSNPTTTIIGTGIGNYAWLGTGIINGVNSATAVVNSSGMFTLTVTDSQSGCSSTATTQVLQTSVNPTLSVSTNTIIHLGTQTTLSLTTNAVSYTWSPSGSLSCNTCSNPIASPTITTQYCAVASIGTCTTQACTTVSVEFVCGTNNKYEVPNAFTPNGDGNNDDFCLKGWSGCVKQFSVLIFNRWGEKMFESDDENFCWDGMYKGKLLDPAVFVYVITAEIENVGKTTKKGNITLIR